MTDPTDYPVRHLPDRQARREGAARRALEEVARSLRELRYGEVTVIVQDGVVVQVERTVRSRLPGKPRTG